jgi:hypothetical protein
MFVIIEGPSSSVTNATTYGKSSLNAGDTGRRTIVNVVTFARPDAVTHSTRSLKHFEQ